jgi:nitrogen fixation NifU-like protein
MNRQLFTDNFLEHYESPRHYGPISDADVILRGTNPGCGDVITIYLKVDEGEIAEKIQFEGEGCTISQGAASILLEMVQDKSLAEIQAIDYNALIDLLGRAVVLSRVRCATLGLSTLKNAIQHYYDRQNNK